MTVMSIFPMFIVIAILLTVIFSQLVKKLDRKNRLKGFRVWLPLIFSGFFATALAFGNFFTWEAIIFWWAAIFGFSVFFYEAIVKHLKNFWSAENEKDI